MLPRPRDPALRRRPGGGYVPRPGGYLSPPSSRAQLVWPGTGKQSNGVLQQTGGGTGASGTGKGGTAPYSRPTLPPPGYYDPGLDSQLGAATRGLGDLTHDTAQTNQWSAEDYRIGRDLLRRNLGWQTQTAQLGLSRANQDYTRTTGQLGQDYNTSRGDLFRKYTEQGQAQDQGARAAGVEQGGALAQAMAKRAVNYAVEQHPLDVSYARATDNAKRSLSRYQQDTGTGISRARTAEATREHQALNTFDRGRIQRASTLWRANRENRFLGLDVAKTAWFEAKQNGYLPASNAGGWGVPTQNKGKARKRPAATPPARGGLRATVTPVGGHAPYYPGGM